MLHGRHVALAIVAGLALAVAGASPAQAASARDRHAESAALPIGQRVVAITRWLAP